MARTNYRALLYFSRRHTATPSSLFFLQRFHVRRGFSSSSSHPSDEFGSIGFIGLGNMGSRMATNLVKAGYKVTVHDINHDAMKIFADKGVPIKETPLDVAEASDVVISMLPSSSHVSEVYTGPNGLLHGGKFLRPWLLIDCSTIDPQTSRRVSGLEVVMLKAMDGSSKCRQDILNEHVSQAYCDVTECLVLAYSSADSMKAPMMLDAPVSGGVPAAEAGTLTFMVGGAEEAYLAAKPLLLSMGRSTVYCGNAGNGSAAKICNNLAMAVSMLGISEALALGQSLGIKASVLTQIFNSSSARCWSSDAYNPVPGVMDGVPSSRNYEGGFASKLMVKDLGLAVASANEVGAKHPLASQVNEMYSKICEEGHKMKDFSCVFRYLYSGIDDHDGRST